MGATPGPWAVSRRASRRVTTDKGVVICNAVLRNSGSAKKGIRHGAKEVLEAEANARLIAAAPDLLEALQITTAELKVFAALLHDQSTRESIEANIAKAEAAIARTTEDTEGGEG